MNKDIIIPTSVGFYLAIIPVESETWDLYLINENEHILTNILVVTTAKNEEKQSSTLRYFLESITPQSFIKFETILGEVAQLENYISATYFKENEMIEKEFVFQLDKLLHVSEIPILNQEGYLIN